jgi:uncharacterized delta-60 repeat protein
MAARKMLWVLGLGLALLLGIGLGWGRGVAYAADGDLDPSFDGDGRVTTDLPIGGTPRLNEAHAVAIQPDGKIVVAGYVHISGIDYDFGLARYLPGGALDTNFGVGGLASASFHDLIARGYGVAIQPDGKIVVVGRYSGTVHGDFAVARFNANGFLDTTFGEPTLPGRTWFGFDTYPNIITDDWAKAVAIQPDGKIIVAGYMIDGSVTNFALARLMPNGDLDNSFDGNGRLTTDFFGGVDEARGIILQPDGKIVAAGNAQVSGSNYDFALARYNSNGSLDSSFSSDGKVTTDFLGGGDDGAYDVALQPDGKIVAAGAVHTLGTGYDFGVARYLSNGAIDTGFAGGGFTSVAFAAGTAEEVAFGVALQADGKIVAAGYAPAAGTNDLAVARLTADGALDGSFSVDGRVTTGFGGGDDGAFDVAVQADGKIVAAGSAYMGATDWDFAVARYLVGGGPLPTATPTSQATPTACPIQFPDVPPGSTFYDYVRCLACRQIVSGYPDGNFGPGNDVTRGQLSKIVSNSAGYIEDHADQTFEDVAIGSTFHLFIERLSSRGYISGYPCGGPNEPCVPPANRPYFRPNNSVTRGQTAKIVASAAGLPAPPPGLWTFQDVPQGSTFWEWVEELSSSAAITGYPCGGPNEPCYPPENRYYFRPYNNVTRGQSAKIVAYTFFPGCSTPLKAK